jgi:hypothetical protein
MSSTLTVIPEAGQPIPNEWYEALKAAQPEGEREAAWAVMMEEFEARREMNHLHRHWGEVIAGLDRLMAREDAGEVKLTEAEGTAIFRAQNHLVGLIDEGKAKYHRARAAMLRLMPSED